MLTTLFTEPVRFFDADWPARALECLKAAEHTLNENLLFHLWWNFFFPFLF